MSWLKTTSLTFARQLSRSLDPRHDYEPQACYSSFCKHWQQANEIILKSQPQHLHDDVLGVVNHLEQLATLLVLEARAREINTVPSSGACLEHLLSENLLDKLYEWGNCTGKYENAVRLEQLKLYGILVSHYGSQVLAAEPFLRPILKLLNGFRNELTPINLENQLVSVLNQLCVVLMQNIKFIDLFFLTNHTNDNEPTADFIISRLLLTFVHREGGAGAAARDALLLCANMSARCPQLAQCMLEGLTCPVLATGLSGLYSLLPRTLGDNIFRLTPDDVNKVHKLTLFIDSLEFCNAVAQVAHHTIKKHLLDLLYQGFLVPVMGPALLQSGAPEQAAAMAYLELVLRCSTQRGLLRAVLHFLFTYEYDGVKLIDVMLRRLDGNSQLSLVSLSLMETLIDLNCEDVMFELVYKHLLNGNFLMTSHRHELTDPEPYREAAMSFLSLTPECCFRPLSKTREWTEELALSGRRVLDFKREEERVNGVQENGIAMNSLVQEVKFNYGNPNETLFGNYHAYLCDARFEIVSRSLACSRWSSKYDAVITPKREPNNNTKETRDEPAPAKEQDSLVSICTSGYDTLKTSDTSEKEPHSLTSLNEAENVDNENSDAKDRDSLISIGSDSDKNDEFVEDVFRMCFMKVEEREYDGEPNLIRSWRASAESLVGPLLSSLLKKAAALLESDVLTNCLVTCVVSKLAAAPSALLPALLLPAERTLQPSVPSLYQILSKLKDELDELTSGLDNTPELLDKARVFLIQREMLLVKARAPPADQAQSNNVGSSPRAEESPLRRGETKRRSLSSSFTNMFGRRLSASPSQPHSIPRAPSPQKRPVFTQEAYWNQSIALRSILNAVILDEWLKELAALCEEHALRLAANYEDDTYLTTVAL
ncbi:FHIP family protein AGAP011705-like isoform X2 [Choristoneura fumiferana]|uniref:FHIP family protein AGAP011705-like isoform X2 n=1 Tax=Choristoneura fumiferana TaxID=7141 RepID=UPI003D154BBE